MLLGLAFLVVSKTRVRSRIARTKKLVVGLDPLLVTTGLDPRLSGLILVDVAHGVDSSVF